MEPIQFIQLLKKHSTRDIFREILIISKNPSNLIESITNILMQCYIELAASLVTTEGRKPVDDCLIAGS